MISLKNISVYFGKFCALKDITKDIVPGDFILIRGHNGAGKTTFFDVLSGRIAPTAGKILRNKKNITKLKQRERAKFMSRVFQNTHVGSVGTMTVAENLAMAAWKQRSLTLRAGMKSFDEQIVEEYLKPLGLRLEELMQTPMAHLSGGQRQIITIIMATLCEPDLLLLDEPSAALDPASTEYFLDFIRNYIKKRQIATLMITHDQSEVDALEEVATNTWTFEKGQIKSSDDV